MKLTGTKIRVLQRSLNALAGDNDRRRLAVDGRLGRRTVAALIRFLAARGARGR